jgi:hypothetical protein
VNRRSTKLEAKKARKAERHGSGTSGPEMGDQPEPSASAATEFVWFSPSKGRTLTTNSAAPPVVAGIDDWMLLGAPPAGGSPSRGPAGSRAGPMPAEGWAERARSRAASR